MQHVCACLCVQRIQHATRTAPVSKHPAFKWGVGLWFALLMGLGLFVMPESIHQALAERLFLDGVLSAASSRIVLSVIAALLGLLIGVVLAMRVAAINDAVHDDDEEDDVDPAWLREEEEPLPLLLLTISTPAPLLSCRRDRRIGDILSGDTRPTPPMICPPIILTSLTL